MAEEKSPKTKKPRSGAERAVVWGGIGILLVLVLVELRAQQGHSTAVSKLTALSGDGEAELAMSDIDGVITWFPSVTTAETDASINYRYNWQSVFKSGQFVLHIVASKDEPAMLVRYYTGDDDPMAAKPSDNPVEALSQEDAPPLAGGGPGGGGGGRGGSREDPERPDMDDSDSKAGSQTEAPKSDTPEEATPENKEPAGEPADPAKEPATEPGTEPATEPGTEPAKEPATEPGTEPAKEPGTEPAGEPPADGKDGSNE